MTLSESGDNFSLASGLFQGFLIENFSDSTSPMFLIEQEIAKDKAKPRRQAFTAQFSPIRHISVREGNRETFNNETSEKWDFN